MKRLLVSSFASLAAMAAWGCGSKTATQDLPSYQVRIAMGSILPERVGSYELTFDVGLLVFSDWAVYGSRLDDAAQTYSLEGPILAHAGHQHGAAELSGGIDGTYVLDLLDSEPELLGTIELKEGHYFDGRIRLVLGDETARILTSGSNLGADSPVFGHTLYLEGTATSGQDSYHFVFVVDVEATVPGLAYARTVREGGQLEITTRLDVGALLDGIDFASLADGDGQVLVNSEHAADTYALLKARLSNPDSYVQDDLEPPQ